MADRLRNLIVFCFLILGLISALPVAAQAQQYIVTFEKGTQRSERAATVSRHGAALRYNYGIIDGVAITVPNENALRALAREGKIKSITPDFEVFATQSDHASENAKANRGKPGEGGGGGSTPQTTPLGVQRVGPATATSTGAGIAVAILDTGIDGNHGDLAPLAGSFNAFNGSANCQDDNGHGTHVAGTVAALNNSQDVIGVAPNATLYCVKVLNSAGTGSWSTIIAGLDWIYNSGQPRNPPVRVVNMSLGGNGDDSDSPLRQAIQRLHDAAIIVVVAAGNNAGLDVSQQVPAAYSRGGLVLTIASTTAAAGASGTGACAFAVGADTASYFTTDGMDVTVSAPGEDLETVTRQGPNCYLTSTGILSLQLGGGTTRMSGTSMATPHVSGIVARLLQDPNHYGLPSSPTPELIRDRLRSLASQSGVAPLNSHAGSYTFDGFREGVAVIP